MTLLKLRSKKYVKGKKRFISLFTALLVFSSLTIPSMAAVVPSDCSELFCAEESASSTVLPAESNSDSFQQEPRPANLVNVQASEKKPGTIRCTILNTGIDMLDNVTVYVEYSNPKRNFITNERDYGVVGFIAVYEDFYIGTDWTSATAYWTITDGEKTYSKEDKAGQ